MAKPKKDEIVELKIRIPKRWADFIDEYCQVTGRDRDQELVTMIKVEIEMPMIEDERLSKKDRVRLVEKYQLSDIYKIPQWVRDDAAGIPREVKPKPEPKTRVKTLIEGEPMSDLIDHLSFKLQPDGVVNCRFFSGEIPEGYVDIIDLNLDTKSKTSIMGNVIHSLIFGKTPRNSVDVAAASA